MTRYESLSGLGPLGYPPYRPGSQRPSASPCGPPGAHQMTSHPLQPQDVGRSPAVLVADVARSRAGRPDLPGAWTGAALPNQGHIAPCSRAGGGEPILEDYDARFGDERGCAPGVVTVDQRADIGGHGWRGKAPDKDKRAKPAPHAVLASASSLNGCSIRSTISFGQTCQNLVRQRSQSVSSTSASCEPVCARCSSTMSRRRFSQ